LADVLVYAIIRYHAEITSTATENIAPFAMGSAGGWDRPRSGLGGPRPLRSRVFFLLDPTAERRHLLHHHRVPCMVFLMQLSYGLDH
jgi:hypothetical protein